MLRFLHTKRMALGLTLLGSLALASGCDDSTPSNGKVSAEAEAQNKAMMDGMKQQYGPGGPASGERPKGK